MKKSGLTRPTINLLEKCGSKTLGGRVLNLAVEQNNRGVVEFLLHNINEEQSKLELESESYKKYVTLVNEACRINVTWDKEGNRYNIIMLFMWHKNQRDIDVENRTMLPITLQESKDDLYASLWKDGIGVVITGALVVAAIMHPSTAFKAVFGALATLVAIGTGLHIKNYTVPSYVEMQKNSAELASQQERVHA
ncbi:MAG TPA: hypothetical protein DEQ74_00300 [Wolbachia sp.]|nr:hypothetical protein [Wolbachia sp.]